MIHIYMDGEKFAVIRGDHIPRVGETVMIDHRKAGKTLVTVLDVCYSTTQYKQMSDVLVMDGTIQLDVKEVE